MATVLIVIKKYFVKSEYIKIMAHASKGVTVFAGAKMIQKSPGFEPGFFEPDPFILVTAIES